MGDPASIKTIPPVWFFELLNGIRRFLNQVYFKLVPANVAVYEKSQGFWIAKAIGVACELNLPEIVGDEEKDIDEIAETSKTDRDALYRLMRALTNEDIFIESQPGLFKNSRLSHGLRERKGSLKHMIIHQLNETNWETINHLKYCITTGNNAAEKVLGTDIFTHLKNSPEKNSLYNKAMSDTSALSSLAITSAYSFRDFQVMADLGGGDGTLLCTILSKHPASRGILFDLPHVVKTAQKMADAWHVKDRFSCVAGSFFKDEIPIAEGYLLKNILHAFDDSTCVKLLKRIHQASADEIRLMIIETVIPEINKKSYGKVIDLQMLIGSEKGRERTREEFKVILEASGFKLSKVINTVSPYSIIESIKI